MERSRVKVDGFPCKKLGYCPYGYLVEDFPVEELRSEKGCPVYGHVCPVFSTAEAVDDQPPLKGYEKGFSTN